MSRKSCRRRVWSTPTIPISFSLHGDGLRKSNLMARAALDAIIDRTADEEATASIAGVAAYCKLMCARLAADGSVDDAQLPPIVTACADAAETIAEVQQCLNDGEPISCGPAGIATLAQLLDIAEQLDAVSTRRQARDVALSLLQSTLSATTQPRVPHAVSHPQ